MNICIRKMRPEDIPEILNIEIAAFSLPWSKKAYEEELVNQIAHYLVLTLNDLIAAYTGMWIVLDEAHITNIAVAAEHRKHGYGEMLLSKLISYAKSLGAESMTLEVRKTNFAAQNLYRKLGFTEYGVRSSYYSDNNEDALIMWLFELE